MDPSRLVGYLPVFEETGFSFGAWPEREQVGLVLSLPYAPVLSPEAESFVADVQRAGFVGRESAWPLWRAEAQRFRDDEDAVASADLEAIRRFFTVVHRTEYQMPGFWLQVMREGTVVRVLRRLVALHR